MPDVNVPSKNESDRADTNDQKTRDVSVEQVMFPEQSQVLRRSKRIRKPRQPWSPDSH